MIALSEKLEKLWFLILICALHVFASITPMIVSNHFYKHFEVNFTHNGTFQFFFICTPLPYGRQPLSQGLSEYFFKETNKILSPSDANFKGSDNKKLGCLPFVRINRLGQALSNGNGFSKISKPTERNGP